MKSILLFILLGLSLAYDANKAIRYAQTYCKSYNPNYIDYRSQGDCANFVSQCLIAGGLNLRNCGGRDGKGSIY